MNRLHQSKALGIISFLYFIGCIGIICAPYFFITNLWEKIITFPSTYKAWKYRRQYVRKRRTFGTLRLVIKPKELNTEMIKPIRDILRKTILEEKSSTKVTLDLSQTTHSSLLGLEFFLNLDVELIRKGKERPEFIFNRYEKHESLYSLFAIAGYHLGNPIYKKNKRKNKEYD